MNAHQSQRNLGWRKLGFVLWLLLLLLVVAVHWYPIRFGTLRLLLVVGVALLWLGALCLLWKHKIAQRVILAVSGLFAVFLLLPSRPVNPQVLQGRYVRALQSYDGTPYVWGGESKRGIDCSGLMRCALIDANVKQGLTTFNPAAIRAGFSLWWNDSSAKALKEEYQNRTQFLFATPDLNHLDYLKIRPGDMAVTSSGVHVVAYIGNRTWIEADPNAVQGDRVIQVKIPTRNAWFNQPMSIVRWRQLES